MRVTNYDYQFNTMQKDLKNIFEYAKTTHQTFCPVRDVITRISDKWSMLTLYALGAYGTLRFNELKVKIGDVSQRMLTVTLRNLEADGMIKRKVYAEVPPRVEYELTALGQGLLQQVSLLGDWAQQHGASIIRNRSKFARKKHV
ncbi:MAG: helix-turn-helix transcriptional regulator [Cyclobacteriaceae bacterium]|jgi:DNA-binding HxlR family transcriptional regulator|nr:helix-turn-helix transcriptional regulator [Cyclobacteriaceae bacterium]